MLRYHTEEALAQPRFLMSMSDSVDRVFVHALNTVKRIPRTGTARPPASERLKLYGLYKQSMEGDVEGVMDRPIGNTADVYAECEKWDAWFAQSGLSRTEAKRRYISTLIETMHQYASQTPEACELVAELEFVWDQIKSNTPPSTASSPRQTVGVPPLPAASYPSIGDRLARSDYEQMVTATARGDSRLRVLSPVSQPEDMYRRRGGASPMREDEIDEQERALDEEEEEEYAEAQDTLYDDDDIIDDIMQVPDNYDSGSTNPEADEEEFEHERPPDEEYDDDVSSALQRRGSNHPQHQHQQIPNVGHPRWRRRVEQALTNMTAEIAAVREQMESRALAQRRRNALWTWIKWLVWVTFRQIIWDLAVLGAMLIWMRMRGDRRLEQKLRVGWTEVKTRLMRLKSLRQVPKIYTFP